MEFHIPLKQYWKTVVTIKKDKDQPQKGIVIYSESSGSEHQLTVCAQFKDEGRVDLNNAWVRSMSVCCVSAENQLVTCCNILKSRAILPGDLKHVHYKVPLITARLKLDLSRDLNGQLARGKYFVTVSCRESLSNTVIVEIE